MSTEIHELSWCVGLTWQVVMAGACMETIHALKGYLIRAFPMCNLMSQMVKNLPAVQETRVPSLDREEPWGKGMATYSSILVWRIP